MTNKEICQILSQYQLAGILLDSSNLNLKLDFTIGPSAPDFSLELFGILTFQVSKSDFENSSPFFVGNVSIKEVDDGGKQMLSSLNYPFKNGEGMVLFKNDVKIYSLRVEGDVCIDCIFKNFHLFKQI